MRSCMLSLQEAIFNILNNDIVLKKKIKGVYDYVEEGSNFPIVTIGECNILDYSTESFDGEEVIQFIHVWSKYKGKKECKEILNMVLEIVFRDLKELSDGFEIDLIKRESIEIIDDPDVNLKHGVIELRLKVRENKGK